MLFSLVLLAGCSVSVTRAAVEQLPGGDECTIPIAYVSGSPSVYQPLLLTNGKRGNLQFLYPRNGERFLRIPSGSSIHLACPGPYNYLEQPSRGRGPRETSARCLRERLFIVGREIRAISSLTCRYVPQHTARRTGKTCLGKHTAVQIGFRLNNTFLETVEVCRETGGYATHYTKFRMTKAIESYQKGYPRQVRLRH